MERKKEVLSIGACAIVLALVLRMVTEVGFPLQNEGFLSFLVYLQTGRVVRNFTPEAQEKPPETAPKPIPSRPSDGKGLVFFAADGEKVGLYDFTGVQPDVEALLLTPLAWDLTGAQPKVLILHTHATESYTRQPGEIYEEDSSYRTFNASYNMLSIGEELAKVLTAGGLSVLHDRTLHDYPSYTGSYDHARKTILAYLKAYPTISLVIDIHRDAVDMGTGEQLTTSATVGGQKSAQLMVVAGSDHNVSHPAWRENLAVSVKLTAVLEKMYPGITRPIQLRKQRFNLDLTPGSLLVEVGANGDAHQEAMVAARALGAAILALSEGANLP